MPPPCELGPLVALAIMLEPGKLTDPLVANMPTLPPTARIEVRPETEPPRIFTSPNCDTSLLAEICPLLVIDMDPAVCLVAGSTGLEASINGFCTGPEVLLPAVILCACTLS